MLPVPRCIFSGPKGPQLRKCSPGTRHAIPWTPCSSVAGVALPMYQGIWVSEVPGTCSDSAESRRGISLPTRRAIYVTRFIGTSDAAAGYGGMGSCCPGRRHGSTYGMLVSMVRRFPITDAGGGQVSQFPRTPTVRFTSTASSSAQRIRRSGYRRHGSTEIPSMEVLTYDATSCTMSYVGSLLSQFPGVRHLPTQRLCFPRHQEADPGRADECSIRSFLLPLTPRWSHVVASRLT